MCRETSCVHHEPTCSWLSTWVIFISQLVVIEIYMAKGLFNLLKNAHEDKHLQGFRHLNW